MEIRNIIIGILLCLFHIYIPSTNKVTDVPDNFKEWVRANADKIEGADDAHTPYFVRDNRAAIDGIIKGKNQWQLDKQMPEDIKIADDVARIIRSKQEYQEYADKGWLQLYFDDVTGGYNVAHPMHQFKNSKPKGIPKTGGEAEKWLGVQLAKQGKKIEFLPESGLNGKSGDMRFDNMVWDCKYIPLANEKTIRAYFKDARKADCVIFIYEETDRYADIMTAINREMGRYKSLGRNIQELPDVYIFDNNGKLRMIKKIKGT